MSDIKPTPRLHALRPVQIPPLGLSDGEAEARCRIALRLVEARPEVLATVDDLLDIASWIKHGDEEAT